MQGIVLSMITYGMQAVISQGVAGQVRHTLRISCNRIKPRCDRRQVRSPQRADPEAVPQIICKSFCDKSLFDCGSKLHGQTVKDFEYIWCWLRVLHGRKWCAIEVTRSHLGLREWVLSKERAGSANCTFSWPAQDWHALQVTVAVRLGSCLNGSQHCRTAGLEAHVFDQDSRESTKGQ